MQATEWAERRVAATDEFNQHENRSDGSQIANSLFYGLNTLRQLLFKRVHDDVQETVGVDSMLLPAAYTKGVHKTEVQIEIYQISESTAHVRQRSYVSDHQWYAQWLGDLRLGDVFHEPRIQQSVQRYLLMDHDERRHMFARVLEKTFREATRAPLVLYQLFPLAVGVATSLAFDQALDAGELRNRQSFWLPTILDCAECHGRPLENGEKCRLCENPLWNYRWLTAMD